MKRFITAVLIACLLLAGCGAKLSDKFDSVTLIAAGENVATLFYEREFDRINQLVREDSRSALSAQVLGDAYEKMLAEAGEFVEFKKVGVSGYNDKQSGAQYAVVMQRVKYEEKTVIYTLFFDINMELTGFYIK